MSENWDEEEMEHYWLSHHCIGQLVNYLTRKEITVNVKCEIKTDEEAEKKITLNVASAVSNKENSVKRVTLLVEKQNKKKREGANEVV